MRDEKHRVYKLNLGKSSFTIEDLPAKNQAFNKMSGVQSFSTLKFLINYLLNNKFIEPNPSFNPTLPESPTNKKYLFLKNWPNLNYLAQTIPGKLVVVQRRINNKCRSNSKTLGNTKHVYWPLWYPENRFYVNAEKVTRF